VVRTSKSFHKYGQQVRTTQLEIAAHDTMKNQLVPMVKEMQRISFLGDKRLVYYYKRKINGKICSCVDGAGTAAGDCQICFKTGIVGGYDKLGTSNLLFNSTSTFVSKGIQVVTTDRPFSLTLKSDVTSGYIIWKTNVPRNKGVDLINLVSFEPQYSSIKLEVLQGSSYVPLTSAVLVQLFGQQTFRISLSRVSLTIAPPKLSNLHLRFKMKDNLYINTDWPHTKDIKTLSDYGIFQGWQSERINIDSAIGLLSTEDFFFYPKKNQMWKIVESEGHDPLENNIGWEATVRLIQSHEVYRKIKL